jgi:hypothetical protein
MAYRTSGVFVLGSSTIPQPLFGSWVTAVSPANGFATGSGAPLTLTLGTAQNAGHDAIQIFQQGEQAWLVDPSSSNKGGVHGEVVTIASIVSPTSNNQVVLGPKTNVSSGGISNMFTENPHVAGAIGTGSWLIPKQLINNFLVQYEDNGAGPFLYLGNSMNMTAVLYRFFKMASVSLNSQPAFYDASMTSPGNPYDVSELWVLGTSGDLYDVSLNID